MVKISGHHQEVFDTESVEGEGDLFANNNITTLAIFSILQPKSSEIESGTPEPVFLIALHKGQCDPCLLHLCSPCHYNLHKAGHIFTFLSTSKKNQHKPE